MINITANNLYDIAALDGIARTILGSDTTGVSVGNGSTIHLIDSANASTQNKAQKIFDNWDALNPAPSVSSMAVGDADPTITQTSADANLVYAVLLDGKLYSSGTVTVVAGTATLTLLDPEAGVYDIYFARTAGNFASGHTTITVTEI